MGKTHVNVATKCGIRRPGGAWIPDGRPERIENCCDASLERLDVETIFLYQLHKPDPEVPLEDTVGAMAELKTQGKVQHLGLSNVSIEQLEAAQAVTRIESVQNACNPWTQKDIHSGLIEHCRKTDVAYLPFHPVGGKDDHQQLASPIGADGVGGKARHQHLLRAT